MDDVFDILPDEKSLSFLLNKVDVTALFKCIKIDWTYKVSIRNNYIQVNIRTITAYEEYDEYVVSKSYIRLDNNVFKPAIKLSKTVMEHNYNYKNALVVKTSRIYSRQSIEESIALIIEKFKEMHRDNTDTRRTIAKFIRCR